MQEVKPTDQRGRTLLSDNEMNVADVDGEHSVD